VVRENDQRFRALVEISFDVIAVVDAQGTILYITPSVASVIGFSPEELLGTCGFDRIHPDDLPRIRALFADCLNRPGVPIRTETRVLHKDGSHRELESVVQNNLHDEAVAAVIVNFRDVTDRHKAEERLRESEERYRALIDNSLGLVCTHLLDGTFLSVNPHSAESLGYEVSDLVGRNLTSFVAPSVRPQVLAYLDRIEKTGSDSGNLRVVSRDGILHTWMYRNILHRRPNGEPYILGFALDVTEQKRIERELRRSELCLRALAGSAPVGIFEADRTGNWSFVNQTWSEITGMSAEDAHGVGWAKAVFTDDQEIVRNHWYGAAKAGEDLEMEYRCQLKNGEVRWVLARSVAMRSHRGKIVGFVGTVVDVTERKRLERDREHLIQFLQAALADVKALQGILPMCASCRKIRDERGHWFDLESYIQQRAQTQFTHGICPDCMKKLYPGFFRV
jgi:PAS domain S-box-containing protein